ncbi:hypothetical protein ACOSP7_000571 [Xanthoceras sorbifolium]|uniref:Transmembrane protein n=1 Tax=Xanthoceras sorbifolium TaxID=99658 RepID=A0ABQ8INE3_9ROSI|nr:hypothetical protein JRO89_XS01G0355800 [Xanthoceras sorbifolium]
MDHLASGEREFEVDIESGGTTSEEDKTKDLISENGQTKTVPYSVLSGLLSFDRYVKPSSGMNLCSNSLKFGEAPDENVELLKDKNSEEETNEHAAPVKKCVEGKRKKTNSTKPSKPPRPPNGPSLDAADEKLVREIAELAMRKRARMERIRALRKMKAAKTSNFNSSLSALIITLLFCLIILFQGLCYRSHANVSMQGSPAPAVTGSEGLISIQLFKNFSADETDGSASLNLAKEEVSGSGPGEESSKVAR